MLKNKLLLLPVLLWMAAQAQAHQIWIEQDLNGARLYLGEFGENLRETSPGMLDKFVQPSATLLTAKGDIPAPLSKRANAFGIDGRAISGESLIAQENAYPGWERKQGDKVERHIWIPSARWISDFVARPARLTLDLVPTGKPGQFQAFYKQQALPEAKVQVVTASGWGREFVADKSGLLQLSLPWKGSYVLELKHTDKQGGERNGQAWDVAQFVTTLAFSLNQGLEPLPLPPPAKPSP